ncbi:MAG: hypothetical protein ACRDP6_29490 [Actinoallomurus sp.]
MSLNDAASVQRVGEVAEQLRQIAAEASRRGQAVPMPAAAVAEIATWMLTTAHGPEAPPIDSSAARAIAAALPELAPRE